MGPLPPLFLDRLREELVRVLEEKVRVGEGLPLPPVAFNPHRHQHSAAELLYALRDVRATGETALGVTEADLYIPGEDFVFGQAAPGIGAAVISLHRLRSEPHDDSLLLSRAVKEAAHELGHLRLLRDCRRPSCVMAPARTVDDIDRKGPLPCATCRARLRRKVAGT